MVDDLLVEEQATGPEYEEGAQARQRAAEAAAYSIVPVTPAQKATILAYLAAMRGTRYDVPQLIEDGFDILTGRRDNYTPGRLAVCSQLVCVALQKAGFTPPFPASSATPADLYRWPVQAVVGAPKL